MSIKLEEVLSLSLEMVEKYEGIFMKTDFIIGVSRGGLIPATIIATSINKPLVTAYIDKQDNVYIDRIDWLKGKNVVIIDDIVRTGRTIKLIEDLIWKTTEAKDVKSCALIENTEDKDHVDMSIRDYKGDINFIWDIDKQHNE